MKLVEAQVRLFRNFIDSTPLAIDAAVTCLVGKNESGKTGFLEALRRIHPGQGSAAFSVQADYPAWRQRRDQRAGDLRQANAVRAVFELDDADRAALEQQFGPGVLRSNTLSVERRYDGSAHFAHAIDEPTAVGNLLDRLGLPYGIAQEIGRPAAFAGLQQLARDLRQRGGDPGSEAAQAADAIQGALASALRGQGGFDEAASAALDALVPAFFYFSQYSEIAARVKIRRLLEADPAALDASERTALALLRMAGTRDEYLLDADYETRKRELEDVANALSDDVLQYWSQNPDLAVQIDVTQESAPGQAEPRLGELLIRLYDRGHRLSLSLDQRSSGFRWFFSFLAAFSEYERAPRPAIILLDEPALSLHPRAQRDFLRFIEERLAPRHQVVYTTHSPFMIQPGALHRVRLVEDRGGEIGAIATRDVGSTTRDTRYPLQAALAQDIVRSLLPGPHNLVVEGTSDFTYLSVLSQYLVSQGRTGLDARWSIVPVGGGESIASFAALLDDRLDATVLVGSRSAGAQKLSWLAHRGYLARTRVLAVSEVLGAEQADLEDLFAETDYVSLYNRAFGRGLTLFELPHGATIVSRIAQRENVERFDARRPAEALLRGGNELLLALWKQTIDQFERLFERINATLRPGGSPPGGA